MALLTRAVRQSLNTTVRIAPLNFARAPEVHLAQVLDREHMAAFTSQRRLLAPALDQTLQAHPIVR